MAYFSPSIITLLRLPLQGLIPRDFFFYGYSYRRKFSVAFTPGASTQPRHQLRASSAFVSNNVIQCHHQDENASGEGLIESIISVIIGNFNTVTCTSNSSLWLSYFYFHYPYLQCLVFESINAASYIGSKGFSWTTNSMYKRLWCLYVFLLILPIAFCLSLWNWI